MTGLLGAMAGAGALREAPAANAITIEGAAAEVQVDARIATPAGLTETIREQVRQGRACRV
jgi:hypothetical protein